MEWNIRCFDSKNLWQFDGETRSHPSPFQTLKVLKFTVEVLYCGFEFNLAFFHANS